MLKPPRHVGHLEISTRDGARGVTFTDVSVATPILHGTTEQGMVK